LGGRGPLDSHEAEPRGERKVIAGAFQQHWFFLGHLKPGVSVKEAEADLTVVAKRLATIYPTEFRSVFRCILSR